MSVSPRDLLFYAGGECLERFGTLVWRPRQAMDAVPTFTRTGAASLVGSDGVLRQASANRPRVSHPLVGGVRTPAYLGEGARTNLLTRSGDLTHADWTASALSARTANQATGPFGTATLDLLVEDSANTSHGVAQGRTVTADTTYSLSVFARANTRSWIRLELGETAAPATNNCRAWFNLSTGAVGSNASNGTGSFTRAYVEDWGGGLYRCVLVGSVGNGATGVTGFLRMATADTVVTYTGDGTSSLYAAHAQLENASFCASSYVATTTASATRNADLFQTDIALAPQAATAYMKWREMGTAFSSSVAGRYWQIGGPAQASDPRWLLFSAAASNGGLSAGFGVGGSFYTASVSGISMLDVVEAVTSVYHDGTNWRLGLGASMNGGAVVTGSPATIGPTLPAAWSDNLLTIGDAPDASRVGFADIYDLKIASGDHPIPSMRAVFP